MINFQNKFFLIIILGIMVFGAFLRFYKLDKFPVGFHVDEAIMAVNGYFILETGKDTNNNFLPISTEVFGDYNPTGYAYLTIIPIKIFGLNEFAARFPGSLLGSLTITALFLLTYAIFQDKKVAIISSLFIAISPWHIILSRSSEQALAALFFVVLGFALLIFSFSKRHSLIFLILGMLLLFISLFMYFTPRVFILLISPIFLISYFNLIRQKKLKYKYVLIGSFLLLGLLSLFLSFLAGGGKDRFSQVSIFNFPQTKLIMEEQIREDGVADRGIIETRTFHNKLINYSLSYASNYLEYFSGNFLFINGGLPPWLKVSGIGLVYLIELPFFIFGIFLLMKSKEKKYKFLIAWLLLSPILAAATVDDVPNIRRSLLMFPAIEIISAYGFMSILEHKKYSIKYILSFLTGAIFLFNFTYFLHQYFIHEKVHRTWYRNNGVAGMVGEVKKIYNNYDKVIISKSGAIYPLLLFYMKYDPQTYLSEGHTKDKEYTGFGKFFFVPVQCPVVEQNNRFPKVKKTLYVNSSECKDNNLVQYKDIYKEDGTKAFRLAYD